MTSMKNPNRSALILGATGLVGNLILQEALNSGRYQKIIVLVRRPLDFQHPLLTQKVVDFSKLENFLVEPPVDDVFCCLGTTMKQAGSRKSFRKVDFEYPVQIAHLLQAQIQHFLVISALGANAKSLLFYNRVKGEMEDALLKCNFPFLTIARPSLLLGTRKEEVRLLEQSGMKVAKVIRPLLCGSLKKYAAIEAGDVAAALLDQAEKVAGNQRTQKNLILESDMMQ